MSSPLPGGAFKQLLQKAYYFLKFRDRSEKEIRDHFKSFQDQDLIEKLVAKLKEQGFINDLKFANLWIESRQRSKFKSKLALELELKQKGISEEIIEEAFSLQSSDIRQEDLAMQALEKKMRIWKNLTKLEFKQKAYRYLGAKGFPYEIISSVIEKFDEKS